MSFLAGFSESSEAKEMAQKVIDSPVATTEAKEKAKATLAKLDRVGKPLTLKFTALDGREIDLEKMRGKVVLIDFWATWCPPCVAEMPHLKAVYQKYHPRGLEIVGLSLDRDRKALEKYVAKEKVPWAQRFDGEPWENRWPRNMGLLESRLNGCWIKKEFSGTCPSRTGSKRKSKNYSEPATGAGAAACEVCEVMPRNW